MEYTIVVVVMIMRWSSMQHISKPPRMYWIPSKWSYWVETWGRTPHGMMHCVASWVVICTIDSRPNLNVKISSSWPVQRMRMRMRMRMTRVWTLWEMPTRTHDPCLRSGMLWIWNFMRMRGNVSNVIEFNFCLVLILALILILDCISAICHGESSFPSHPYKRDCSLIGCFQHAMNWYASYPFESKNKDGMIIRYSFTTNFHLQ
mmetsp:Transcript_13044/g.18645  ORF Transcript_13044/g.18645 Transcript_13044/m.18645 type:complete len:204 (+) Transcript_13044:204-815(+)